MKTTKQIQDALRIGEEMIERQRANDASEWARAEQRARMSVEIVRARARAAEERRQQDDRLQKRAMVLWGVAFGLGIVIAVAVALVSSAHRSGGAEHATRAALRALAAEPVLG